MKPAEYNDDELNPARAGLAPKLSSIEKKKVFSVPADYFDSLPDQIMDKVSTTPQFEEIAVSNPFTVPENYFEELPLNIINRIEASQSKRFTLAGLLARVVCPKYSLSLIAACFALFISIKFFERPINMNASNATAQNISISESDVLGEVDESTLMNEIADESTSAIKTTTTKNAGDKNIQDYIINNNIDISDVAKEL